MCVDDPEEGPRIFELEVFTTRGVKGGGDEKGVKGLGLSFRLRLNRHSTLSSFTFVSLILTEERLLRKNSGVFRDNVFGIDKTLKVFRKERQTSRREPVWSPTGEQVCDGRRLRVFRLGPDKHSYPT